MDHREVKYRFILTELELALTFCEIAIIASDEAKSKRNIANAQQACDAVEHFFQDSDFSENMNTAIQEKLLRLTAILENLNGKSAHSPPASAL